MGDGNGDDDDDCDDVYVVSIEHLNVEWLWVGDANGKRCEIHCDVMLG